MKVLVTGATGFIGDYVLKELLKYEDIEIIATYTPGTIPKTLSAKISYEKYKITSGELPDAIIYLAWPDLNDYKSLSHIKFAPEAFDYLKSYIDRGVRNISVIGTCFEYGKFNGRLFESLLSNPENNYAIGKDALRRMLAQEAIDLKWLRLFYLYGEGQRKSSLIPKIEEANRKLEKEFVLSGCTKVRDYLHVEKVAEYIVKCALQVGIDGIINIASNEPITIERFVSDYIKEKGFDIKIKRSFEEYPDLGADCFYGDNEKLKKVLGKYEV